jgi:hypothetical protein
VGCCEHDNEPSGFIKGKMGNSLTSWTTISFSRRTKLYKCALQLSTVKNFNLYIDEMCMFYAVYYRISVCSD